MSEKNSSSTKPYLIRALYEWCTDNGYTPHLSVKVQGQVRVPMEFVRNGEIVLNIAFSATSGLLMDNRSVRFKARFGGVSREIFLPIEAITAIFASENGQGMAFEATMEPSAEDAEENAVMSPEKDLTTDSAGGAKSGISLAVTNKDDAKPDPEKKLKENRKKPSFTVIK